MEPEKDASSFSMIFFFGALCISLILFIVTTIWRYIASRRIGPITKTPVDPFKDGIRLKREFKDVARFVCGYGKDMELKPNYKSVTQKLKNILTIANSSPVSGYIPSDVRVISVKMEGFDYGNEPQDFVPMDGLGPKSYYSYQMYGEDAIQVTYYNEDDVSYAAGFCIYVESELAFSYRREVVKEVMKSPKYNCTRPILEDLREEIQCLTDEIPTEQWSVKFCNLLKRDVMIASKDGSSYHKD